MLKLICVLFVIGLPAQHISACQKSSTKTVNNDYQIILNALLNLPEDASGAEVSNPHSTVEQIDELAQFKILEQVYERSITPVTATMPLTMDQVKTLLWFNFYAHQVQSGAFLAYLASDLLPVYRKHPQRIITVLNAHPFLVVSTCQSLNAYFGFEGLHAEQKNPFMHNEWPKLKADLSTESALACANELMR